MNSHFIALLLAIMPLTALAEPVAIWNKHYEASTIPVVDFDDEGLPEALAYLRTRVSDDFSQWEITDHVSFEHDFSPTKLTARVNLKAKDIGFLSALDRILRQCGLTYKIDGRRITISDLRMKPEGAGNQER